MSTRIQMVRYTGAVGMAAMLEALSGQNDNLTLPLYLWSVLVVAVV
jgi:dolichol kinase